MARANVAKQEWEMKIDLNKLKKSVEKEGREMKTEAAIQKIKQQNNLVLEQFQKFKKLSDLKTMKDHLQSLGIAE
jgi:hypothetical protein